MDGEKPSWKDVAASVAGSGHAGPADLCQDFQSVQVHEVSTAGQILIAIVADGAGSAAHGAVGARHACEILQGIIGSRIGDGVIGEPSVKEVRGWFSDVATAIVELAASHSWQTRELACTVSLALVAEHYAVYAQVGDGAIVVDAGGGKGVVFWPEQGEYANETYFITDAAADDHLHVTVARHRVGEIALLTDGLQMLALSCAQKTPHVPFFEPMFEVLRQTPRNDCAALSTRLATTLSSEAFSSRTIDDRTLVLATRRLT